MKDLLNTNLSKNKYKQKQSQSLSALQHFSSELNEFQCSLKTTKFDKSDKNSRQRTVFQPINSFCRKMGKNKENTYWEAEKKVDQLDHRLSKLEMEKSTIFSKRYLIKMLLDRPSAQERHHINQYSSSPNNSFYSPPYILQPLIIPIPNLGSYNMVNTPPLSPTISPLSANYTPHQPPVSPFPPPPSPVYKPFSQPTSPVPPSPQQKLGTFTNLSNQSNEKQATDNQNRTKAVNTNQNRSKPYNTNQNKKASEENKQNIQKKLAAGKGQVVKIEQHRRSYLIRRMKIIFMSVYFAFLFQTYSKVITYKRYLQFLQLQQIMNDHQTLEYQMFEKYMKFDIFQKFQSICRTEQVKKENFKYQAEINFEGQALSINVKVCHLFISHVLEKVEQSLKIGEFQALTPIFMNFLDRGFPPSFVFLEQELELMNLHTELGWLNVSPQISKLLITVYFFVKIFIYQSVGKRQILPYFYKKYLKKWESRKFILLYGKKIVSTIIILHSAINSIYFSNLKKLVQPNYFQVSQQVKPQPMQQMDYNFNLNSKEKIKSDNQLMNQLHCDEACTTLFIQIFQENWNRMKNIVNILYETASKEKLEQLATLKEQALNQAFPNRELLHDIRNLTLTEDTKKKLASQQKPISDKLNQMRVSMSKKNKRYKVEVERG